jgi:uncharacterized protein (DUF4415 family)
MSKTSGSSPRARRAVGNGRRTHRRGIDFSDLPESSDEQLRAMRRVGRPPLGSAARRLIAIRIDPAVLVAFAAGSQAAGAGLSIADPSTAREARGATSQRLSGTTPRAGRAEEVGSHKEAHVQGHPECRAPGGDGAASAPARAVPSWQDCREPARPPPRQGVPRGEGARPM